MVAIVSGNSLGLINSSSGILGSQGATGQAEAGRAAERLYVNAATGNLVLQHQDDSLIGRGPDIDIVRTYNSQAQFTDDNADNWRLGLHKQIAGLTGTVNSVGSTVRRTDADGAELIYTYDSAKGLYVNRDGSGSLDTLGYYAAGSVWTWRDGDTQTTETYDWTGGKGKLLTMVDADYNTLTYSYTGNLLTCVTDTSGEKTWLDYSGNNLTGIRQQKSDSTYSSRVRYGYDASNRLTSVTVDLTPDDNSIADGAVYTTSYTYDSTSTRVASITQSDGSQTSFVYTTQTDGSVRVTQINQSAESGVRTTTLSYNLSARTTTVTDPLGNSTVTTYDTQGRLLNLTGPTISNTSSGSGTQSISTTYDTNGNVATQTDARGNTVVYQYDANGNMTLQRDAAGNTITRTYDTKNQLLTDTVYASPDPDGAGSAVATQPQTTRYAYDNTRLRFIVSPEGRVTEYRYNGAGQRIAVIRYTDTIYDTSALAIDAAPTSTALSNWAASASVDKTRSLMTAISYDFRGQISQSTVYTKVGASGGGIADGTESITQYVYDQAGLLLKTVAPKGVPTASTTDFVTTYTYDGMGRRLSTTDVLGNLTVNQYDDANRKTKTIIANGLATTLSYNRAGELISAIQADGATALGTTKYWYDADARQRMSEDPTGVRTYMLYDEAGRKIADIDGKGSLTEYTYDANNALVKTLQHAIAVSSAAIASLTNAAGEPANVTLASIRPATSPNDRSSWDLYDSAHRLAKSIDALGTVTEYRYDGANRVTDTIHYATALTAANLASITISTLPTSASVTPATDTSNDRRTRKLYDNDGNLRATLDADGYLTEYQYDAAGRLIHTIGYATQTDSTYWSNGTLTQLRPAASSPQTAQDIHQWTLYDGQGRVTARVDGEGYLTEAAFDVNGNVLREIHYASKALIAPTLITATTTLAALRPPANTKDRTTSWSYTDLNQIKTQTDPEGTVTQFTYDNTGNVIRTDKAFGTTDLRTLQTRYDKQGRVIAELSAEGSSALAALSSPTQAQIDTLWNSYSIKYSYDNAGRRTTSTDQNNNRTIYYYDTDGHLVTSINAAGEVTGNSYNALGQLTQTTRYSNRIAAAVLPTLTGGLINSAVTSAIVSSPNDSIVATAYDVRGQISQTTDALGNTSSIHHNAFGETDSVTQNSITTQTSYNRRGLATRTIEDSATLKRTTQAVYDAFGRTIQSIDALGQTASLQYDRTGHVIQTTDATGTNRSTSYDAFARVLTQTDGNGNTVTTTYNDATRSITITSAEGISFTTIRNRHGETVQITDGNGNTTSTTYDKNGNLKSTTQNGLSLTQSSNYDNANRIIDTTDAKGIKTTYTYDAANRLLTRTLDPTGLNLTTSISYDAKGQIVSMTNAAGVVTQTTYDKKGQVTSIAVDPTGINRVTQYTYDAQGNTLTVTESGAASAATHITRYTYDTLGRRIQQEIDPTGLDLKTSYTYDLNNNVIAKTDAMGHVTRTIYDADNQPVYNIDALGAVSKNDYDNEGHLVAVTSYANSIALTGLTATTTPTDIAARITTSTSDQTNRTIYNRDGQAIFTIDASNQVSKRTLDANGNVIAVVQFANPITLPATFDIASLTTATNAIASASDRTSRTVFDSANRPVYAIDALAGC